MRCDELINEFLMAYLDRELPLAQRLKFEAHLALCRSCRAYLDQYRKTVEIAREAMKAEPAGALPAPPEDLVKAILASAPRHGA